MKEERLYLEHILECIEIINQYVTSGRESLADEKTLDAVLHRIQIMVESSLRLPEESTKAYPEVGWQHLRNFRNRLVHQYLETDVDLLWRIIQNNIPLLKSAVEDMVTKFSEDEA